MADRGTVTPLPTSAFNVLTDYDPITRGSGSTTPLRFLNVGGVAVPIQ